MGVMDVIEEVQKAPGGQAAYRMVVERYGDHLNRTQCAELVMQVIGVVVLPLRVEYLGMLADTMEKHAEHSELAELYRFTASVLRESHADITKAAGL